MDDADYAPYADSTGVPTHGNPELTVAPPFGWWGYLGTAEAAQSGFKAIPPGPGGSLSNSSSSPNPPGGPPGGLPAGAQAAAGKCSNIVTDFNNAQAATSLAGIQTMSNAIFNDVHQDPDVKNAMKAWSACMARNGYTFPEPETLAIQDTSSGPGVTPNKTQIAAAVADANCTNATDLAGIYFAVQASYEKQLVTANQQALDAAVRQYKASYASELTKLAALLRTASATPALKGQRLPGGPGHAGTPTPTHF
jgi:hypothetical protein